jgi:predicted AAA+ superfamily ATPase
VLILDEIHKYRDWRRVIKGLFDKRGAELKILVTGSARLDHYRRGGDSLQGRYHFHRLLPFSYKEVEKEFNDALDRLFRFGGFPEQLISASDAETQRWSREYRTRIIQEDLRDLENVSDISKLERMSLRLPELVGSPLSLNSLREDIQVAHKTVSRWVDILENLYMIFRLYPFGASRIRAVKKEAKHYHYDWTLIEEPGIRFENLIAVHLLKWVYFQQDTEGKDIELRYFRDRSMREVDFVITEKGRPTHFIETKLKYRKLHVPLRYLKQRFPQAEALLVTREKERELITKEGIHIISAKEFLGNLI